MAATSVASNPCAPLFPASRLNKKQSLYPRIQNSRDTLLAAWGSSPQLSECLSPQKKGGSGLVGCKDRLKKLSGPVLVAAEPSGDLG